MHNPETLLNTEVFVLDKGVPLHAGKEHHYMRSSGRSSRYPWHMAPYRPNFHEVFRKFCMLVPFACGLASLPMGNPGTNPVKHRKVESKLRMFMQSKTRAAVPST